MKKFFMILTAACTVLACQKANDASTDLSADEQQNKFKEVSNAVMDEVSVKDVSDAYQEAMSFSNFNPSGYESTEVYQAVLNTVASMTTSRGEVSESVYQLYSLSGIYSFVGGKAAKTPADNVIEINAENTYFVKVEFSQDKLNVKLHESPSLTEYALVPKTVVITVSKNADQLLKLTLNMDTNYTDATSAPDPYTLTAELKFLVEFAGYKLNIERAYYGGRDAELTTSIARGEKVIAGETITVNDVEFYQGAPCGSGSASLALDFLGQMQVKASVKDVTAFIATGNKASENCKDETAYKEQIEKINSMVETGVYFGTDVKQCWIEFYPFYQESYYSPGNGSWYTQPVLVLADGSKFEDPSEFFSEAYYKSVLDRAEQLFEDLCEVAEDAF